MIMVSFCWKIIFHILKQQSIPFYWWCSWNLRSKLLHFFWATLFIVLSGWFYRWGCGQVWHQDKLEFGRIWGFQSPAAPWVDRMPYDFPGESWRHCLGGWQLETWVPTALADYTHVRENLSSTSSTCVANTVRMTSTYMYHVAEVVGKSEATQFSLCGRLICPSLVKRKQRIWYTSAPWWSQPDGWPLSFSGDSGGRLDNRQCLGRQHRIHTCCWRHVQWTRRLSLHYQL